MQVSNMQLNSYLNVIDEQMGGTPASNALGLLGDYVTEESKAHLKKVLEEYGDINKKIKGLSKSINEESIKAIEIEIADIKNEISKIEIDSAYTQRGTRHLKALDTVIGFVNTNMELIRKDFESSSAFKSSNIAQAANRGATETAAETAAETAVDALAATVDMLKAGAAAAKLHQEIPAQAVGEIFQREQTKNRTMLDREKEALRSSILSGFSEGKNVHHIKVNERSYYVSKRLPGAGNDAKVFEVYKRNKFAFGHGTFGAIYSVKSLTPSATPLVMKMAIPARGREAVADIANEAKVLGEIHRGGHVVGVQYPPVVNAEGMYIAPRYKFSEESVKTKPTDEVRAKMISNLTSGLQAIHDANIIMVT